MGRKPTVDLDRITAAAVAVLDEDGLAGLSTRRVAAKLGVQSPSLYWHVRSKDELLDLVAEAICADAFVIDDSLPWRDQLLSGLRQFRRLVTSHRDAAQLLRERPPSGPHRRGHIETTLRILAGAGFAEHERVGIAQLLAAHVLTSVTDRSPDRALSAEEQFELGAEVILDGLTRRVASGHQQVGATMQG